MDQVRWFAPNRYCTLPVPPLRRDGLTISLDGDRPAHVAVAADGQSAVAAYEYSRRHRCPVALYLWDLPPWRLGSGKPDFIFEAGGRILRVARPLGGYPERAGYYSRIRFVAQRAVAVWCPSANTVYDVRARFGIEAARVPFCYDSDRFRLDEPAPPVGDEADATILSISRLVPHKNHAAILRAVARLGRRVAVRIIGQGSEAPALRRLADSLGVQLVLTDNWASDDEIVQAYRSARVVISASRFEGFGLTPIEGLVMGVPVVASDIPPHREFLEGMVRFFPLDDDAVLADQIDSALSEPRQDRIPPPIAELSAEACAERFRPRLERLIASTR